MAIEVVTVGGRTAAYAALRAHVASLTSSDRSFADSLLKQGASGLSEKQWKWIGILARRATGERVEGVDMGRGMRGVIELIDHAAAHLKRPKLLVAVREGGEGGKARVLRLTVAGERSRAPGSINVTSAEGSYEGREWYGRITRAGEWQASDRVEPATATAVALALAALAANPAKAASEYGRIMGICCFCNIALKDERSVAVGYGAICAEHYGLPWGERTPVD